MKNTAAKLAFGAAAKRTGQDVEKKFVEVALSCEQAALTEMDAKYRPQRELVEDLMQNILTHRVDNEEKNIFRLSNRTMGLVRAGIAFVSARVTDDIFGSAPWFGAEPEGMADVELSERIQKHAAVKLREADFENIGEMSVDRAFNFGEAIYRTGWRRDVQKYERLASVLCEGPEGKEQPVLKPDGSYIEERDLEVVVPEPAEPGTDAAAAVEPRMMVRGTDIAVDGERHRFCEWVIEEEEVTYEGLDPLLVDWRNFRCATSYASIERAPFRGHIYERRFSQLVRKLEQLHGVSAEDFDDATKAMLDKCRNLPDTPQDEARVAQEGGPTGDEKNPVVKCLDFEMEWDPEGKGETRWYFGTVLVESEQLFFVDYLANILKGGGSLYDAVAVYCLPNTWVGRGWWELYEEFNDNADRLWNTLIHRDNLVANPPAGVQWDAIEESKDDVQAKIGQPGFHVSLRPEKTMGDFLSFAVFPNRDQSSWELLQFFMKLYQLETGVTSSAQGGLGDMPATNTATGIQSVLASGSTLHKRPAKEIRDGLKSVVGKNLTVLYTFHNKEETLRYGEGQNAVLVTLRPEDVRDLKLNVRILMTRYAAREQMDKAQAAVGVHTQYIALPEPEKAAARPLYVQLLKAQGIQGAEDIIRQPMEMNPNEPPPPNPLEQVKVGYTDLPAAAKVQLLTMMGFQNITPEMVMAEQIANEPAPKEAKP